MEQNSLTVSQVTRQIQSVLETSFDALYVSGEISNFKLHSSGHRYFTLKDSGAQISCVMWKARPLNFMPTDGMNVIIYGALSVYEARGNYQIDCFSIRPLGKGDLHLAFEALKQKLLTAGYFSSEFKKPLPRFPMKIGVVTSPTGAAVRDILATLLRRMPSAEVYFRPALVQGEGAAEDISQAIFDLNETDADVLIIGRGGGSIEDLWAFNTEIVAKAIFESKIPIISAVGHETDITIADFVADARAATPTAAAEIAVRDSRELLAALGGLKQHLDSTIIRKFDLVRSQLARIEMSSGFRRPIEFIRNSAQKIDDLENRIHQGASRNLISAKNHLTGLEAHFTSLYPLAPLRRGFGLLKSNGKVISANQSLANFSEIEIHRADEIATAKISNVQQSN